MWTQVRGSKFGSKKKEYNGYMYMSKKEAKYAQELDLRLKAKDIKSWEGQVRMPIKVNGYHICNYIVDFLVVDKNGENELHEVKGFRTALFDLKWKLCEAIYGKEYKMILIT